jgi:hypothetical protein
MGAPPPIIPELVRRFERNLEAYRSQGHNETQVRQEFVNPFFESLGLARTLHDGSWRKRQAVLRDGHAEPGGLSPCLAF